MNRRYSWGTMILYGAIGLLILIGMIVMLKLLLIPIVVLGTIFLLYKYPPQKWRIAGKKQFWSNPKRSGTSRKKHDPKSSKRPSHLRVIPGSKQDDEDDDKPKYH